MAQVKSLVAVALLGASLAGGMVAHGAVARAQDVSPIRDEVQRKSFGCTITAVATADGNVTSVSLAIDPEDTAAADWPAWVSANIGTAVSVSLSHSFRPEGDTGKVTDNASGLATVDLDRPGTPQFPTEVGTKVNLFYAVVE